MVQKASSSCLLCCDVKVGTVILATLFMLFGLFGSMKACYNLVNIVFVEKNVTLFTDNETTFFTFTLGQSKVLTYGFDMAVFLVVIVIAVLAFHGISKNKPYCLAPLIVAQSLIVLRTVITAFHLIIYWSSLKSNIKMSTLSYDVKLWLLNLSDPALGALVFGMILLALLVKGYLLMMIFRCYEHIKAKGQSPQAEPESANKDEKTEAVPDELPDYKDIQKCPLVAEVNEVDVKPPVYTA